jgi:glycine/D-amino acid oxidase-like deaminating enzyme
MSEGQLEETDVLVIGGGILGCATTYHLATRGVAVTLVDKEELNREASGTNAGSLHFQIMRQPDYAPERLERLRKSVEIHAEAARVWRTLESDLGCDLGLRLGGGFMVAETPEEMAALEEKHRVETAMGVETEFLRTAEMRAIAPCLSSELLGADYCPHEGFANPLLLAPAFARNAIAAGAHVRIQTEVIGIDREESGGFTVTTSTGTIRARRIVNAAGTGLGKLAEMVGHPIAVEGHPLLVGVTEPWPMILDHLVQHVGRRLTLKQTQYGTFIIGGGWPGVRNPVTGASDTLYESMVGNNWVAASVVPAIRDVRIVRAWGGVIPTTPDRLPIIGELPEVPGYFVMHIVAGFTLGPVVGRLMAERLAEGRSSIDISDLAPGPAHALAS